MTVPTIDQIQAGIKRRLETIEGLRPYATEPDKPNFPLAYPRLVDWTYDEMFEMAGDVFMLYHFDIWVLVSLEAGLNRAQTALNPYLSPAGTKSLKAAIEEDVTLGGVTQSARVTSGGAYGQADIAGIKALAASVRLEVYA